MPGIDDLELGKVREAGASFNPDTLALECRKKSHEAHSCQLRRLLGWCGGLCWLPDPASALVQEGEFAPALAGQWNGGRGWWEGVTELGRGVFGEGGQTRRQMTGLCPAGCTLLGHLHWRGGFRAQS